MLSLQHSTAQHSRPLTCMTSFASQRGFIAASEVDLVCSRCLDKLKSELVSRGPRRQSSDQPAEARAGVSRCAPFKGDVPVGEARVLQVVGRLASMNT